MASRATGKSIVAAIAVGSVAISAIVIAIYVGTTGTDRLPQQVVRFGLTCALGYFLYRGASWARWTAIVLFALGALVSALTSVVMLTKGVGNVAPALLTSLYTVATVALLFNRDVRAHFREGRRG